MENLAFDSLLRWKIIILPILITSHTHFSVKGWENVLMNLGVNGIMCALALGLSADGHLMRRPMVGRPVGWRVGRQTC